jgi:hypothetical protein
MMHPSRGISDADLIFLLFYFLVFLFLLLCYFGFGDCKL